MTLGSLTTMLLAKCLLMRKWCCMKPIRASSVFSSVLIQYLKGWFIFPLLSKSMIAYKQYFFFSNKNTFLKFFKRKKHTETPWWLCEFHLSWIAYSPNSLPVPENKITKIFLKERLHFHDIQILQQIVWVSCQIASQLILAESEFHQVIHLRIQNRNLQKSIKTTFSWTSGSCSFKRNFARRGLSMQTWKIAKSKVTQNRFLTFK